MKFKNKTAEIFVPDGTAVEAALKRTTWMGIGAHPDDLEILASSAILEAFQNGKEWFSGVVVTDGRGSPRTGSYEKLTDDQITVLRKKEQKKAAVIGEYGSLVLLDYPSSDLEKRQNHAVVGELIQILEAASPKGVFTHNLADKHGTHVAVALRTLEAIRKLPTAKRPKKFYGCEVWRSLDWLSDDEKVVLDLSRREHLRQALLGVYDSQIGGGKRYDLATMGRERANATFHRTHDVDAATAAAFAMDLTPLIENPRLEPETFVAERIEKFARDVRANLKKYR